MKNKKVIILVESALCVALSTALSFFAIYKSPFGGDVTFASCLPIALLSYRRGIPCGIAAGFVYSIIQLLMGLENISYATGIWSAAAIIFLDYIIPFTIIGFSGMFRKTNRENTKGLQMITFGAGIAITLTLRYICHILSGAIVWHSLTVSWGVEENSLIALFVDQPWLYSIVYNGIFMVPEIFITTIAGVIISSFLCLKNEKFSYKK